MSTFLQLCQQVASDSGTIEGTAPASVVAQTGRLQKIVTWVQRANRAIQTSRKDWLFLDRRSTASALAGTREVTSAALPGSEPSEFGNWKIEDLAGEDTVSAYQTALGVSDEGEVRFVPYNDFLRLYLRGTIKSDRPHFFTVDPQKQILLEPVPDVNYTLRLRYKRLAQELTANADVPIIPVEFHDAIAWRALIFLATYDEAESQYALWNKEYMTLMGQLIREYTPRLEMSEPLA